MKNEKIVHLYSTCTFSTNVYPDHIPLFQESDLGMHCLPMGSDVRVILDKTKYMQKQIDYLSSRKHSRVILTPYTT